MKMRNLTTLTLATGCLLLVGAGSARAQGNSPDLAQVVIFDECDPTTFNAFAGPDFCKNVTLGAFTTLSDLLAAAEAGTPDPGLDFEPDQMTIKQGTIAQNAKRQSMTGEDAQPGLRSCCNQRRDPAVKFRGNALQFRGQARADAPLFPQQLGAERGEFCAPPAL